MRVQESLLKTKSIFQHVLTLTMEEGDNWFWKGDEPYCIKMPIDNVDSKHEKISTWSKCHSRSKGKEMIKAGMKNPNTSFMTWFVEKGNGKGNWGSKIIEHNWTRYHIWWWIISRLIRQYHYFLLSMLQIARWAFWQGLNAQCVKFLEKEVHSVKANNI